MKFLIVTYAPTLKKEDKFYSYAPYVYEMNVWSKHITKLGVISPISYENELLLSAFTTNPKIFPIKSISFVSIKSSLISFFRIPLILIKLFRAMQWADHIHLRCPGNIGLLGSLVQIFFKSKPKTVKYAGNWDPKSKQPLSYRFQKWILSNTFLTRNTKVLVYGDWPDQTKNIIPFFTASYSENEIEVINFEERLMSLRKACTEHSRSTQSDKCCINFIFVGALSNGKQPMLSVKVVQALKDKGYQVRLDLYGEGGERSRIENYIDKYDLQNEVILHGNVSKDIVKKAYQKSHFLLFISKSEGWPKVVAEAMIWGCLPITSSVSCTPFMLAEGMRGGLVSENKDEVVAKIESYISNVVKYQSQSQEAMKWSRQFTLEKFEIEIGKLINSPLERG